MKKVVKTIKKRDFQIHLSKKNDSLHPNQTSVLNQTDLFSENGEKAEKIDERYWNDIFNFDANKIQQIDKDIDIEQIKKSLKKV